ncbi:molybdopterin-guanine dinucleotide biosynthesis protein B [Pseudahrensia aquimaris]|uniref:Molybdopterin-guanine dinucleotide biosynthesis protein B n=1 Tax=Pseudahrensia aquimaris TaxID=744461 RepID=A0ABW3FLZ2_9HYPH
MTKVFGITGWKNSGKTTLVARLVEEFTKRGLRVSTIKHASHTYTLDHDGTDTFAHKKAGAYEVAIAAGSRWAVMHEADASEPEQTLETMLARLTPCDMVLVEGFKTSAIPKLQTMRSDAREHTPMWETNETVIAIAADHDVDPQGRSLFRIDDVTAIADYIISTTPDR